MTISFLKKNSWYESLTLELTKHLTHAEHFHTQTHFSHICSSSINMQIVWASSCIYLLLLVTDNNQISIQTPTVVLAGAPIPVVAGENVETAIAFEPLLCQI